MTQPYTYKQLQYLIQFFASRHEMINDFRDGDPEQWFANSDLKYRALCVDAMDAKVNRADKTKTFPFDIWIFDLANVSSESRKSETDIISDLQQIADDCISYFGSYDYQDFFTIPDDIQISVAIGKRGQDDTIAVNFQISFIIDFLNNRCQIPINTSDFNDDFDNDFNTP